MSTISILVQSFVALLFVAGVASAIRRNIRTMSGQWFGGQDFGKLYTETLYKQITSFKGTSFHFGMGLLCVAVCLFFGWKIVAVTMAVLYVVQYAALRYYATASHKLYSF